MLVKEFTIYSGEGAMTLDLKLLRVCFKFFLFLIVNTPKNVIKKTKQKETIKWNNQRIKEMKTMKWNN